MLDKTAAKRLCAAILGQAIKDFKDRPDMRFQIEKDLKNSCDEILEYLGLPYDTVDKRMKISEINSRHRAFLKAKRKADDFIEANNLPYDDNIVEKLTWILDRTLGWTAEEVVSHMDEYGIAITAKRPSREMAKAEVN